MILALPWMLLLLLPLAFFTLRSPRAPLSLPFPARELAVRIHPSWKRRLSPLPRLLRFLAGAVIVLCLAGPRAGSEEVVLSAKGIDIQLVLDTSPSMTRTGLAAGESRLDVAKRVIDQFVKARSQDRIGLITFARFPRLVCPLTLDHEALSEFLKRTRPAQSGSEEDTTALGVALASAVLHLKDETERTRVVVLLTDGEEKEHDIEPMEAAELARAHGIKVYAIAVAMRSGKWAKEMRSLGEATGGQGFVATDARALAAVYQRIDRLERQEVLEHRFIEWSDLYPHLLWGSVLFMLLEIGLELLFFRRIP
ncbi:MAG: VWA domain-containing protein [Planctomycetota bacterium]